MNALSGAEMVAKPFTRIINTPPALPWDQERAAKLEAKHTSPISTTATGQDLTIIVRRLEPWKPRAIGRFVAIYLRGSGHKLGLSFWVDVHGRQVKVDIPSKTGQTEALKQKTWIIASVTIIGLCLFGQAALTINRRSEVASRLDVLEIQTQRLTKQEASVSKAKQNAQALAELNMTGRTPEDVINALRTVTLSRDTNSRIEAFLWEEGDWALEVRGEATPLKEMSMMKAPKPVRRGVWLWVKSEKQIGDKDD
jgi:hypothetical protein